MSTVALIRGWSVTGKSMTSPRSQLMNAAITNQQDFLDGAVESSRAILKLDIELIEDGTYFVIETTDDAWPVAAARWKA